MTKFQLHRDCCLVWPTTLMLVALLSLPVEAADVLGYVGPGSGLTMLGALLAVFGIVAMGMLGLILYPIRAIRRWHRRRSQNATGESGTKVPATVGTLDE